MRKNRAGNGRLSGSGSPLRQAAEYIFDRLFPDEKEVKLSRELTELGCGKKNCIREYYVRKTEKLLLAGLLCLAALTAVLVAEKRQDRSVEGGVLERPGYGENGTDQSLNLTILGEEESEMVDIHLNPRLYTVSEARALLKAAEKELSEILPGDNASPDEVRSALCLPESFQGGAVSAEYYITPSGMIGEDGSIIGEPQEEGTLVTISAALTCQKEQRSVECCARIFPPYRTARETLRKQIRDAIESAQTEDLSDPRLKLPQEVDGKALRWTYPKEPAVRMIILLLLLLPAAIWVHKDSEVRDRAKERRVQLELDYSQLLWKLTMLLSAGLTIRGAFTRIAAQYEAQQRESRIEPGSRTGKKQTRYAYEELILTLREMQSGVPEASAYENFGRRCGLPSYIKLGSLLSQNLKKGSKGLTALLEHEAVLSLEQHKMAARKAGEKAAIRMLLPMILMFGVVLIILMVPAFLTM